ncbi:MAG TPA: UDP-N-acetylmuramate dehydrogenase [Syntrophales bacterium]|nr:UDP-N-acetylmuramate dehydrogenase [Syntrophales bacterium]HOX93263.1 UDP-N-acetylmuramate dehydrogenase [Syntrophales bacterium]HPI56263.1 UDP-N-acetylmuramate dehydrogenase [Syntrophales bacterium]HPN24450.1 UDP-N-acetylmuramate dehydrogenase [Syntrophales bacterium]HQM29080.1 UDP-N-acetylmuramate dehydrogenase [Syntrophales bacterium]
MTEPWKDRLKRIQCIKVLFDEPMAHHTSIGVGGKADALIFPEQAEALRKIIACLKEFGIPFLPVGNGTNLIVRDGGFRGAIIVLRNLKALKVLSRQGREVDICAEAGVSLADVVSLTLSEGLEGMEFCAGIPGSVGGAVRMNAGAYGREMKDILTSVSFINGSGTVRSIPKEQLRFEYRNLELPGETFIVSALFRLHRGDRNRIEEKVSDILKTRWSKHPLQFRNAGSIFKNPARIPAGKLIEEAGLKGLRVGDAEVSSMHGNFIVNLGHAKARDILALIEEVQKRVLETKGISLETEVKVIGEDG